jgi:hypothetical protein
MAKVYALDEVQLILGTVPLDEAVGQITVTPNSKNVIPKEANDGVVVLATNKKKSKLVKIQCFQGSSVNDRLSAIKVIQDASPAGTAGVMPFVMRDLNGTSVLSASEAIITGDPEQVFGEEVGDREWEILLVSVDVDFTGGN